MAFVRRSFLFSLCIAVSLASFAEIPVPPECTPSTTGVINEQSTPIAADAPNTIQSTLVVSNAGPYLLGVDVAASIHHTRNSDLQITLTSPAGTIVTLSSNNGGDADDVFGAVNWSDRNDPAGLTPFPFNAGSTTDNQYIDGTSLKDVTPEEPLGAFVGENPNGTWTLTVADVAAGEGGSLLAWAMELATLPAPPTFAAPVVRQNTTPATLFDGQLMLSTITIPSGGSIFEIDVTANITHPRPGTLVIQLVSPQGRVVTLSSENGGSNANVFAGTTWDDDADPDGEVPYTSNAGLTTDHPYVNGVAVPHLAPEEALSAFRGDNPGGAWTLRIFDASEEGQTGTLNSWSLSVITATCGLQSDLGITVSDGKPKVIAGQPTTYTIVASNAGPSPADDAHVMVDFQNAPCTWTCDICGTASGSGAIDVLVDLPSGASATFLATCVVPAANAKLTATADINATQGEVDVLPSNNHATDAALVVTPVAIVSGTKTVSGSFVVGGEVTYTITLTNSGPGTQNDNAGNEFTDILPSGLALVSASASSGTVVATIPTKTVTWNGSIAPGTFVQIVIHATVLPSAAATTVSNQGTISFDLDGGATNEASAVTDDPATAGANDPTSFAVPAVVAAASVPALSPMALLMVIGLLAIAGAFALKH